MLTKISDFLRRHEPITKLLLRLALLAVLACAAWDFHFISFDISDMAARMDQMQDDISNLRDDIENGDDAGDAPAAPTKFDRTPI